MIKSLERFVNKANITHKNKYDYSLVDCKNVSGRVKIICPIHGEFNQIVNNHLRGAGCPSCNESKGEKNIKEFLIKHEINYEPQKKFIDCKYKEPLPFDFYLMN
jgi:hypothetical protein